MIQNVYAIRDEKAALFLQPFMAVNDLVAVRTFGEAIANEDSRFRIHAPDFSLHRLGQFNQTSGELAPEPPQHLAEALDIVTQQLKEAANQGDLFTAARKG